MAAVLALRTRAGEELTPGRDELLDRSSTATPTASSDDDVEPPAAPTTRRWPRSSRRQSARRSSGRPKLKVVSDHVVELLEKTASPGHVLPLHRDRALPRQAPRREAPP
jgi:hypothetical protein